jgi:hypothetical protein
MQFCDGTGLLEVVILKSEAPTSSVFPTYEPRCKMLAWDLRATPGRHTTRKCGLGFGCK